MKAEALTPTTLELPKAIIVVELTDGKLVIATGFVIREKEPGEPIIIIKAGKTTIKKKED